MSAPEPESRRNSPGLRGKGWLSLGAGCLTLALAQSLPAATLQLVFAPANGDWNDGANWLTNGVAANAVPGQLAVAPDNDRGIVNNGHVANVTVATPPTANPYEITVGNGASGGVLNIQAGMTNITFIRLATIGTDAEGNVFQSGGVVSAGDLIVGQIAGAGTPTYQISGGTLSLLNDLAIESSGTFSVQGGSAVVNVGNGAGDDLIVTNAGTLKFVPGLVGINPINLTGSLIIDSVNARLVVDGSSYDALDGYFPLVRAGAIVGSFATNKVTFTGFGQRFPALVYQADGLWLRLTAPPTYSAQLCSLFPTSTIAGSYGSSIFSATREYDPSGSAWTPTFSEAHVMDTRLSQSFSGANSNSYSWDIRVGRGGHLYSLRVPSLGETVAPSWRSNTNSSPWNDEVWQGVAVDRSLNDPNNSSSYFIHQSGPYFKNPDQTEPFYSPQVAASLDVSNRTFTTINWGQHAQVDEIFADANTSNDWKSHVLYFTRYKDLGAGVLEVSLGIYNYGPDKPDYLNMPWGGVRRTTTEYAFLSNPGSTTWSGPVTNSFSSSLTASFNSSGGWMGFSDSTNGSTPSLGMVFGSDPGSLPPAQTANSVLRAGYAGGTFSTSENTWRNYFVMNCIRLYDLPQGKGVWSRHYFVLGTNLTDIATQVTNRGLRASQLAAFNFSESTTPLIGYQLMGSGATFQVTQTATSPSLYLYAHPVTGSFPIYEIIKRDHSRHLTWNPFAIGVIKPYDGTIAGIRLLGFAPRTATAAALPNAAAYTPLNTLMSGPLAANYLASGESLSVLAGQTLGPVTYPPGGVVAGANLNHASTSLQRTVTEIGPGVNSVESGQVFTLTQPTLLSALAVYLAAPLHPVHPANNQLQLWVGEYTNNTPGAAYVNQGFSLAGTNMAANQFLRLDFTNVVLPVGQYAFQLAWQMADDSHAAVLGRSTNDVYGGGGALSFTNAALPLPVAAPQQDYDLVFALEGAAEVIKRSHDTHMPRYNLLAIQTNGSTSGFPVRYDATVVQSSGQSFTLTNPATLSAVTLKYGGSTTAWDTNAEHKIKLWIGAISNGVPGATSLTSFINLAGYTLANNRFYTFDFADTELAAGTYALQLGWTTFGTNHTAVFLRSTNSEYAGGDRLFTGTSSAVPLTMSVQPHDAVFALHAASAATIADTGTVFPTDHVVVSSVTGGAEAASRYAATNSTSLGQSFTLNAETTLSAVTLKTRAGNNGSLFLDGGPQHTLDLWIGAYTSNSPYSGVTCVLDTVTATNFNFVSNRFVTIDFTDVTLPPGKYAFELAWQSPDATHALSWERSSANAYASGGFLTASAALPPGPPATAPFFGAEQGSDLVFALHQPGLIRPVLTIFQTGNNHSVQWTPVVGTLQSAPAVTGPWSPVTTTSPHVTAATHSTVFYRVKL